MKKPRIAITLGDPAGIGPEITAKALSEPAIRAMADFTLIGDQCVYAYYGADVPPGIVFCDAGLIHQFFEPRKLSAGERGKASYAYLRTAVSMVREGKADALVTAPINKCAVIASGVQDFTGHTEMLADAFHVDNVEMMFVGGPFKTIIATRHIPLRKVPGAVTVDGLFSTLSLAQRCLTDVFRISCPRIAVCGLNPHAGEDGKIGHEEIEVILPALQRARSAGISADGPFAADTLFVPRNAEKYDLIIAMYHDQGLAPIKAMYFNRLVNLTVGLPFIRTSTAHGTAEDIVGQGQADPSSMIEAIRLAADLSAKAIRS